MKFTCSFKEYWALPEDQRPQTIQELAAMLPREQISGIWERCVTDARTGEVMERNWLSNVVTDNGALNCLKNMFAATGGAITPYNVMAIASDAGSTKLTSSIASGANITSLSVAALPAAINSGTQIKIGYGTAGEQTVTCSANAASGATSITITSYTTTAAVASNTDVVPLPVSTDNPSSLSGAAYLSLVSGDYTYTPGTGAGNRYVTVTKKFPGASTAAGTYTSARLSNANPVATGSVGATLFLPQATINTNTDQTFTFVIKI